MALSFKHGYPVRALARAIFIGALNLSIKMGQEDACLFVVLDFGLVRLFA